MTAEKCIALMDGQAILVCDTGDLCPDNDELLCFLSMQTEIRGIRTDAQTAEWLFAHLGGQLETGEVMQPALAFTQSSDVVKPFTERETYPLLKQVFGEAMPPFEAWYVDVSHRRRHGLCRIVGIEEKGKGRRHSHDRSRMHRSCAYRCSGNGTAIPRKGVRVRLRIHIDAAFAARRKTGLAFTQK